MDLPDLDSGQTCPLDEVTQAASFEMLRISN